ncbi:MAG: adenylyltransferase/cytidyltransferase family protein [Paracoccaceae bacterium]|jgi:glycerol-3-phosphate cytidylyltransferase
MTRVLVDMSLTLFHHGHVRLLRKAAELGHVTVALTVDEEIKRVKGFVPPLNFEQRKEIALSIRYVDAVIPCNWLIDENFLDLHKIDLLVHGEDYENSVPDHRTVIFPRTEGISSSLLRNDVFN